MKSKKRRNVRRNSRFVCIGWRLGVGVIRRLFIRTSISLRDPETPRPRQGSPLITPYQGPPITLGVKSFD